MAAMTPGPGVRRPAAPGIAQAVLSVGRRVARPPLLLSGRARSAVAAAAEGMVAAGGRMSLDRLGELYQQYAGTRPHEAALIEEFMARALAEVRAQKLFVDPLDWYSLQVRLKVVRGA